EPRTFAGQVADDKAHARGTSLDLLIVLAYPVPHSLAAVPRGIVPDQQQGCKALRRELCRAPRQEVNRDRAHGTPRDKPEPHRTWLWCTTPHKQPITGQGLGIGIVWGQGQLLQLGPGLCVCPAMLLRLGQAAPPDFVAKPQRPRRLGHGPLDQLVTPFFSRVANLTREPYNGLPCSFLRVQKGT